MSAQWYKDQQTAKVRRMARFLMRYPNKAIRPYDLARRCSEDGRYYITQGFITKYFAALGDRVEYGNAERENPFYLVRPIAWTQYRIAVVNSPEYAFLAVYLREKGLATMVRNDQADKVLETLAQQADRNLSRSADRSLVRRQNFLLSYDVTAQSDAELAAELLERVPIMPMIPVNAMP
jgi:hypothetical protein